MYGPQYKLPKVPTVERRYVELAEQHAANPRCVHALTVILANCGGDVPSHYTYLLRSLNYAESKSD